MFILVTFTRAQCSTQYGIGVQKNNAKKQKRRKKKLPKNISCENCSQKFATRIQLHAHEAQRQSDSKWECCVCERLYSSKRLLIEHLTSHYPQEAIFKCPVRDCDKAFFYEGNLNRHLDTHGRFRCMDPTCIGRGKKFATRNNLDSHTRRHLNILTERCIICNKYYADKRALNSHKTTKIHQKLAKERQHQNRSNLTMQNQN